MVPPVPLFQMASAGAGGGAAGFMEAIKQMFMGGGPAAGVHNYLQNPQNAGLIGMIGQGVGNAMGANPAVTQLAGNLGQSKAAVDAQNQSFMNFMNMMNGMGMAPGGGQMPMMPAAGGQAATAPNGTATQPAAGGSQLPNFSLAPRRY
jgi:hypothetical protein